MPKDACLSVRVEGDMKAELEAAAAADGRKPSALVVLILKGWLRDRRAALDAGT